MSVAAPPAPPAERAPTPHLDRLVARSRRRMRTNRVLAATGPVAVAAGAAGVGWAVMSRLVLLPPSDLQVWAGIGAAAALALLLAAAVRIPAAWAAWAADRWLDTRDLFVTALALRDGPAGPPSMLAVSIVDRAEQRAAGVRALPVRPLPTSLRWGAALVAAGLVLTVLPNPQDAVRERRAAERAAVAAQAEALRRAAEELTPAAVAAELEALAERLERLDLPRALEELAAVRAELAERLEGDLAATRTALAGLARELAQRPLAAGDTVRTQLERAAADLAGADPAAQAALAERLQALAEALAAGLPEVAAAMREAAAALRSGDSAAAADALRSASGAVGAAVQGAEAAAAVEAAVAALDAASAQLRAAQTAPGAGQQGQGQQGQGQQGQGQQGQGQQGQGQGQGSGQSSGSGQGQGQQGPGAGQGQGQGQGQGSGQGQGQGAGQGQGPGGGQTQGGGGGGNPTGNQGVGGVNRGGTPNVGTPGRPDLATVYDPPRITGDGEDLHLGGDPTGPGPDTTVDQRPGTGVRNPTLVPYLDVLARYRELASRAIERAGFPLRLRDVVRAYFDAITHAGGPV